MPTSVIHLYAIFSGFYKAASR